MSINTVTMLTLSRLLLSHNQLISVSVFNTTGNSLRNANGGSVALMLDTSLLKYSSLNAFFMISYSRVLTPRFYEILLVVMVLSQVSSMQKDEIRGLDSLILFCWLSGLNCQDEDHFEMNLYIRLLCGSGHIGV